jgi:hypothetical protein
LKKLVKGQQYQQLLLRLAVRKYPFTMEVDWVSSFGCQFTVGVLDRRQQAQAQNSHFSGRAVCYDNSSDTIHYGDKGKHIKKKVHFPSDSAVTGALIVV